MIKIKSTGVAVSIVDYCAVYTPTVFYCTAIKPSIVTGRSGSGIFRREHLIDDAGGTEINDRINELDRLGMGLCGGMLCQLCSAKKEMIN